MKAAASSPAPFLVRHVDPCRVRPGRLWMVKQGDRWRFTGDLCIQVTVASIEHKTAGPCLSGVGVVTCLKRGQIAITA
jgi:hypothetical protein